MAQSERPLAPPFIRRATVGELRVLALYLRERVGPSTTVDDLVPLVGSIMDGYRVSMPSLNAGQGLFRGRVLEDPPSSLSHLSYPPASVVGEGRANRAGSPMLYVTTSHHAVFYETRVEIGQRLALVEYRLDAVLPVMAVGYTESVATALSSSRAVPMYGKLDARLLDETVAYVDELLSEIFAASVPVGEEWRYRASIAIAQHLLNNTAAEAVLYPTVSMKANADNLAIRPRFADRHLKPVLVRYLEKLEGNGGAPWRYTQLDAASTFGKRGRIHWQGSSAAWNLKELGETVIFEAQGGRWHIKERSIDEDVVRDKTQSVAPELDTPT
jgi:hypothetical protein